MKTDIDRLMADSNLDVILVIGGEEDNTIRDYMTNRNPASGWVVKRRGEDAIFIVNQMEVEEAHKSGLVVKRFGEFNQKEAFDAAKGDMNQFAKLFFRNVLKGLDIRGRVALYGTVDISRWLPRLMDLMDPELGIELMTDKDALSLFQYAYETKDDYELNAMREAAQATSQIVADVWDLIATRHHVQSLDVGSPVLDDQGKALTIGAVKAFIRERERELGMNDPSGCIFSQGRDAAFGHSQGEDSDVLQVGKTIVFDIFPKSAKTGYYHDMTRTWCIGAVPEEIQAAYDDVMKVFELTRPMLTEGTPAKEPQLVALDYFEERNHPTLREDPGTPNGYNHSLGHGLGLDIHEGPTMHYTNERQFRPGCVISIEPGLYYPDKGFGVRVEDTVYIGADGHSETLSDFRYDLLLPIRVG